MTKQELIDKIKTRRDNELRILNYLPDSLQDYDFIFDYDLFMGHYSTLDSMLDDLDKLVDLDYSLFQYYFNSSSSNTVAFNYLVNTKDFSFNIIFFCDDGERALNVILEGNCIISKSTGTVVSRKEKIITCRMD